MALLSGVGHEGIGLETDVLLNLGGRRPCKAALPPACTRVPVSVIQTANIHNERSAGQSK